MMRFPERLLGAFGLSPQKLVLLASDLVALLGPALIVLVVRSFWGNVQFGLYASFFQWLLLLFPVLGLCFGLYQGIGLPPHRELKALWLSATLTYTVVLGNLFMAQTGDIYSRAVITGSWLLSLVTLPTLRGASRWLFARRPWWGHSLVLLDTGATAQRIAAHLHLHPERGLVPVKLCDLPEDEAAHRDMLKQLAATWPSAIALVVLKNADDLTRGSFALVRKEFGRVLLVGESGLGAPGCWFAPRDLGRDVGLLVRQNLRDHKRLALKRGLDILLCLLALPLLLPVFAVLFVCIRLDSPGPAIYRQSRIGQGGRTIRVCKFRTMVQDADAVLKDWLEKDAALREEWERDHKLKNDPRITRVGAFLRKTSLDELPQCINVLLGDMSLVGPRPIVPAEVEKYGDVFDDYCRVKPGITGLWQTSGRNNTTYEERVALDHYYISNWSVWMDVWLLGRTIPVVLTGYGAY